MSLASFMFGVYQLFVKEALLNFLSNLGLYHRQIPQESSHLTGKTVILTGCTRGIGLSLLEDLIKREANVIMGCRDIIASKEIAKKLRMQYPLSKITIKRLDLASFDSIREFVRQVKEQEPFVDILVNNAGVISSTKREETIDGHEWTVGVNYFGTVLLTLLLLDSITDRILFVSSCSHGFVEKILFDFESRDWKEGYSQSLKTYARSKASLVAFTRILARRLYDKKGMKVYSVDPGVATTDIARNLPILYSGVIRTFLEPLSSPLVRTWKQASDSVLLSVLTNEPYDPDIFHFCDGLPQGTGFCTRDQDTLDELWEMTRKVLNLQVMDTL